MEPETLTEKEAPEATVVRSNRTSVTTKAAPTATRSTYHKIMDREAWTHAVVSAAIVLEMDKQVCRRARVVLGGVAPIPWRLPAVEQML